MYELLQTDLIFIGNFNISEELVDKLKEINASLAEACGLALRLWISALSFRASGYSLMIEENDERKLLLKRKTFAPVAFGSRVFSPAQLKISVYCKIPYIKLSSNIATYYGKQPYQPLC